LHLALTRSIRGAKVETLKSGSLPVTRLRVLVVDDEKNIRATLSLCLEQMGCTVTAVPLPEAALAALRQQPYDLAFLDLRLGESNGLDLIPKLLTINAGLQVIVITAYATIDTAVDAIKRGATDYLPKPFTPQQIRHVVEQSLKQRDFRMRLSELEGRLQEATPAIDLETDSPKIRAILEVAAKAAASDAPVLLRGESGTGKSVLARLIHSMSPRKTHSFIVVNCPTLSEELLASELFGHAKGAFTGAVRDQAGRVEAAEGGTLFLDEIGEITPSLQAKLLRFLEDKEFERIGENKTRHADVRTVAATNRNLDEHVQKGLFREDLLYRLNVIDLQLPALRERPEDILRLARRFLLFFAKAARRRPPELSKAAEDALLAYAWPGNIRELRNAVERAVILWPAQVIEPEAFPPQIGTRAVSREPQLGGDFSLDEIEREHIRGVVARAPTLEDAATILKIDGSTLWRKRKKYEE
jgi:NtrC-family two-component system response regulator AlgB